jgi:hypothetical protein
MPAVGFFAIFGAIGAIRKALTMSKRANALALATIIVMVSAGAAQGLSGKNTIFSNDIAEGEVHSSDIKNGSIRGKDVDNNSLTGKDIDESTLNLVGVTGDQGSKGDKGDTGATGPAGVSGWEPVTSPVEIAAPGQRVQASAPCPAGKVVTGGGYQVLPQTSPVKPYYSSTGGNGTGWVALLNNTSAAPVEVTAFALCANVS